MEEAKVRTLVFSSSATVYGDPETVPIREDSSRSATNPYGRSKLIMEDILDDLYKSKPDWNIARLRYFKSVLQVIHAFEKASSRTIPYEIVARRTGDIAQCWADASLAFTELGWKATRGLAEMCEDSWRWQNNNPEGFQ